MALAHEKPNASLLAELEEAARHAGFLRQVGRSANALPSEFPVDEIERIGLTPEKLPAGTAEGCRVALDYGRLRLTEIGQQQIRISIGAASNESDETPPLTRCELIDQALGKLLLAMSYAQSEYARQAGEAITEHEPEVRIQVEGAQRDDLDDLVGDADKLEGELANLNDELGRAEIALSRLQQLFQFLERIPLLIEQTASALKRGVDIAEPLVEQ